MYTCICIYMPIFDWIWYNHACFYQSTLCVSTVSYI